jgi:hypothetical protein
MKVNGIAYWASVYQPNTTFEPKYQIDLIVDKETAKKLEEHNLKVVPDEERGGFLVKFSKKAFNKEGAPVDKPRVVDARKEPMDAQIGNGSEVNVLFHLYDWAYGGKKGTKAVLDGVQVVKLVEYTGGDDFEVLEEEEATDNSTPSFDDDVL